MRHFYEVTSNPGNKLTFKELLIGTTINYCISNKKDRTLYSHHGIATHLRQSEEEINNELMKIDIINSTARES